VTISGRQFVSHTNYLSSAYTIGDLSHSVDQRLKDDYVLIIHSKSATAQM
jgi:hypothetical protein